MNNILQYYIVRSMLHIGLNLYRRAFLFELGGNPNKRNSFDETSLHKLCLVRGPAKSPSAEERRYWSLIMMLQWRGALMDDGRLETVQIMARDKVYLRMRFFLEISYPPLIVLANKACQKQEVSCQR